MPASEARILANRANSLKSTGPKTVEGKARSRRNGLQHGMAGAGVVLPEGDAAEVERRHSALLAELAPGSEMGEILVRQLATLSVRMEQGARQELAAASGRVRHAVARFDEERLEQAERLMDRLGDDPRRNLRQLERSPEGVDLLVRAWQALRSGLTRQPRPEWDRGRMATMANLLGLPGEAAVGTPIEALTLAHYGNFAGLDPADGAGLADEGRRGWARARLVGRIDEAIAGLAARREALDLEAIALDRAEAEDRALFDPSKEATLARRYEAEARRGFFRALKEFRQVEADVEAPEAEAPEAESAGAATPEAPEPARAEVPLASSRDRAVDGPPGAIELRPPPLWPPSTAFARDDRYARGPGGVALTVGLPARASTDSI